MTREPTHADILTEVRKVNARLDGIDTKIDDNRRRITAIEAQGREYSGALKLGKWLVWLLLGIGGIATSIVALFKD